MKQFKFRAWDGQKMILFDFSNIYGYEGEVCGVILPDCETVLNYNSGYGTKGINEAITIMQFTGVTDKNDIDIYEGDIISGFHETVLPNWDGWGRDRPMQKGEKTQTQTDKQTYSVYYDNERAEFRIKDIKVNHTRNLYERLNFEVIGNIYQGITESTARQP